VLEENHHGVGPKNKGGLSVLQTRKSDFLGRVVHACGANPPHLRQQP
jgi:hypothetical protein